MELEMKSLADLPNIVETLIPLLEQKRIWFFYGEMGVGKTTFITELLNQLGIKQISGSPTYSIINSYESELGTIHHMDLYRLKSQQEAFDIGLEEIIDSNAICLIEWPQLIENWIESDALLLKFSLSNSLARLIRLEYLPLTH